MQGRTFAMAGVVLLAVPVHAEEAAAQMQVSVAVPRHATIVASTEPTCLMTTDVRAAHVEYHVRSTSLAGIELEFAPAARVEALTVRIPGETAEVVIPQDGGALTLRGHPPGETPIEVEFSFRLAADPPIDCLAWPIAVLARPL